MTGAVVEALARARGPRGGDIVVVSAAPSPWLDTVIAAARELAPVRIVSPAAWRFAARLARAAALGATDRQYRAQFAARAALDALAARRLHSASMVISSSLAARRTFAAAHQLGPATVLLLDLPHLRTLHKDLDAASLAEPSSRFLRRFRASPRWVARQEAEIVLADLVLCRSSYAAAAIKTLARRIAICEPTSHATLTAGGSDILLAGGATSRAGLLIAAEACARLGRRLLARRCDGTEIARHPAIHWLDGPPPPVAAVVAPARCEAYPPEIRAALAAGIPVLASEAAAAPGARIVTPTPTALATALLDALG